MAKRIVERPRTVEATKVMELSRSLSQFKYIEKGRPRPLYTLHRIFLIKFDNRRATRRVSEEAYSRTAGRESTPFGQKRERDAITGARVCRARIERQL